MNNENIVIIVMADCIDKIYSVIISQAGDEQQFISTTTRNVYLTMRDKNMKF